MANISFSTNKQLLLFGAVLVSTLLSVLLLRTPLAHADVGLPNWWGGQICDTNNYPGSYQLSSSSKYDGVIACGPGPTQGGTDHAVQFTGYTFTNYEWECVELAERFLDLVYGVAPYSAPGGKDIVANYPGSTLTKVTNNGSSLPTPGDVFSESGTQQNPYGHTGVITAVNVTNGNGTVSTIEQNSSTTGVNSISVSSGVLQSNVSGWLHNPTSSTDVPGTDSVSWASGRIDIFTRGSGGDLQHTFYTSSGGWSPTWESLGGGITGTPSAVSWQSGQLFVFVRGTDSHLYQDTYNSSTGWSGYIDLGGNIASAPAAVSWSAGRIDIFARGPNSDMVHTFYTSSGGWSTWESLGGGVLNAPSAVSWQSGRIDTFVEGTDYHLYQRTYTTSGGWTPWTYIGGTLASGPGTVSWGTNRIDVFAGGTASDLCHTFYDVGGWSNSWESLGGGIQGNPSAVSWQSGQLFVFVRGNDNHLYQKTYNSSTGWSGYVDLGVGPW